MNRLLVGISAVTLTAVISLATTEIKATNFKVAEDIEIGCDRVDIPGIEMYTFTSNKNEGLLEYWRVLGGSFGVSGERTVNGRVLTKGELRPVVKYLARTCDTRLDGQPGFNPLTGLGYSH